MRVLLVEDELDLGTAIKRVLKQEKYIVDWAKDGNEAWAYLENHWTRYTLGIFDWLLPHRSGVDLCRQLRTQHNPLPVLLLTAKDQIADKTIGLDAGADDYLVKPFQVEELLARLRALQRRSPNLQPQEIRLANLVVNYTTRTVYSHDADGNSQPISLTNKEFQLLEYFVSHPNHTITVDHLFYQLWEGDAAPISNVVAAQIRLLRRKLEERGCNDLIETLPSMGYRLNPTYAR
jgi:DNA-binding response OmpR family regulator